MITSKPGAKRKQLYLVRRRPRRYEGVEARKLLWINLNTDSLSVAQAKSEVVWQALIEGWRPGSPGRARTPTSTSRPRSAWPRAGACTTLGPRRWRLCRCARSWTAPCWPGPWASRWTGLRRAVLGGAPEPRITLSPDQLRRWQNPRRKAIRTLVEVITDKPMDEITGDDMLRFREWWLDRIEHEGLNPETANKDLIHLGDVLKTVNRMKRLGLVLPLSDLVFKTGEKATRLPFSEAWIAERILAPGALDGLNVEARNVLEAMVNTGLRLGEASNLQPGHIHLDEPVPYVEIAPTKERRLKAANARRQIPLVGVSLAAMRESLLCPGVRSSRGAVQLSKPACRAGIASIA